MKPEELQTKLQDIQEVSVRLDERLTIQENKEIQFPEAKDYNGKFDELKALLESHHERDNTSGLQDQIKEQVKTVKSLIAGMSELKLSQESVIRSIPKKIRTEILHRFEDKSKGFIIGGIVLLLFTAISVGSALHLLSENGRMQESDLKFRLIRQTDPVIASLMDTLYRQNPDSLERIVEELEDKERVISRADKAVNKNSGEASQARQEAEQLKKSILK